MFASLDEAVGSLFHESIHAVNRVSGGDINRAYRIELNSKTVFVKANQKENLSSFIAEAEGLAAIAATDTIRVPQVICMGTDDRYGSFLMMEWCEGRKEKDFYTNFGRNLARMHQADTAKLLGEGKFGFRHDNYIGSNRQMNCPTDSWIEFFRSFRLQPQFRMAESWFDTRERKQITKLLDHLDEFLVEPDHPSLLHGDLWSGNYLVGSDGAAWLIDPAAYVGCAEADLAMTELFGGFPNEFYAAYQEMSPMEADYKDRRDIYNLYHLLNHLNLFGGSYLGAVKRILTSYS